MLEFISTHWVKLYALASIVFYMFVWVMKKTYASKEDVGNLGGRVAQLENDFKQLPTKDSVHELDKQLVRVSGQLEAITPQLQSVQRMTDMLTENELKGDK